MPGAGTSTGTTQQNTKVQPWRPTVGPLTDVTQGIAGQIPNAAPTAAETGALGNISAVAQATPNYAPQAGQFADTLISGGTDRTGVLSDAYGGLQGAYGTYQDTLSPFTQSNYLDPYSNPYLAPALSSLSQDIENQINGLFFGSGREMSGAHLNAMAKGMSSGLAPLLLGQYNTNVGQQMNAANSLYGGAGDLFGAGAQTASGLSALDQTALGNQKAGFDWLTNGMLPASAAGDFNTLTAENIARTLPLNNLNQISGSLLPIAAAGQQTSGTGTTTQTMSPLQQAYLGTKILF